MPGYILFANRGSSVSMNRARFVGYAGVIDSFIHDALVSRGFSVKYIPNTLPQEVFNFERVRFIIFLASSENYKITLNSDLLMGNFIEVALPLAWGCKALVTAHIELPEVNEIALDPNDVIRTENLFDIAMFWRRIAADILYKHAKNAVYAAQNPVEAEIVRGKGVDTYLVVPNIKPINRLTVDLRYDLVVNAVYWKMFGVKALQRVLSATTKAGLRVAVHDYHSSDMIKKLAVKHGADYYSYIENFSDVIKLYSSTKSAYIITGGETFGVRFYEIGQITPVFTNVKHWDSSVFRKVSYEEIPDVVKSIDNKAIAEMTDIVKSRVQEFNKEPYRDRVEKLVDYVISKFNLRPSNLRRWIE